MERLLDRLAALQARRYGWFLLVGVAIAAGSVPLVGQLGLNSDWTALLPRDTPSVRDLELARSRVGGLATLTTFVTSESGDVEGMKRLAKVLVPRLEAMRGGASKVRSVEWNVGAYADFVERNRHLYASVADITKVRDSLRDRLEWERAVANPAFVALDDPPPDPREILDELATKARDARARSGLTTGGFHLHPSGKLLAIYLRTDISPGDATATQHLMAQIDRIVAQADPARFGRDLRVEFGGDLVVGREEHDAIARELVIATLLTIGLCLLAIQVFFLRVRAIPLLGLALSVPVLATFAFAELAVDQLNTATAFLGSIVIGNGINPMIIWLGRYFEERRNGLPAAEAVASTHRGAWSGTLTASLAASFSYGSLLITDFRGFSDFGIIGGVGMVLCWLATVLLLPAFVLCGERIRPMRIIAGKVRKNVYGWLISKAVFGAPRTLVAVWLVVAVAGLGLTAAALAGDPFEYDFRNLRSARQANTSRESWLAARAGEIGAGGRAKNSLVLLVSRREQAPWVHAELDRRRDRAGPNATYGSVRTIDDLLPSEQPVKVPLLREVRELLLEARSHVSSEERALIDEQIPPSTLRTVGDRDLPADVARVFTERDGTRGRMILVEQRDGTSVWNGLHLVQWTRALRAVRLPSGERPLLVGRGPVFADMLDVILADGPKAVMLSFLATALLVLLTFRRMRNRLVTLLALIAGVAAMTGTMAALGMKLNFLNFVALPITFGIGVDYSVNVMRRYVAETAAGVPILEAVRRSLDETGGAVILCSLTTIFGYLSLLTSANLALKSFGYAMTIGELTCLGAAVLLMPAAQIVLARRGERG